MFTKNKWVSGKIYILISNWLVVLNTNTRTSNK